MVPQKAARKGSRGVRREEKGSSFHRCWSEEPAPATLKGPLSAGNFQKGSPSRQPFRCLLRKRLAGGPGSLSQP